MVVRNEMILKGKTASGQAQPQISSSSSSPTRQPNHTSSKNKKNMLQVVISILLAGSCMLNYWHATQINSPSSISDFDGNGQQQQYHDRHQKIHHPNVKREALMESYSSSAQRKTKRTTVEDLTIDIAATNAAGTTNTQKSKPAVAAVDPCQQQYQTLVSNQTTGITPNDLRRSRAWVGNEQRLARFMQKLAQRDKPVNVISCGGSITMGHGVIPKSGRYSNRLEAWLNQHFPLDAEFDETLTDSKIAAARAPKQRPHKANKPKPKHSVENRAAHGADMCAMAKRMNLIFGKMAFVPDLVILEFGVNDYQGQDHKLNVDHKTDMFFDGFLQKATCAEAVVFNLMHQFPNTAVLFLEFQSSILTRKTAQLLHMGVAQHYQIPVISYSEAIMPGYYRLLDTLKDQGYTAPIGDSVFPYPHGCYNRCHTEFIMQQFASAGCQNLCDFARISGLHYSTCKPTSGREKCYLPFFAHDAVHPSYMGHGVAFDLIAHALASVQRDVCHGVQPPDHVLPPKSINFLASDEDLTELTDFVSVKDTMDMFAQRDQLNSFNNSKGFIVFSDGFAERRGWICTEDKGGNYVEFQTQLPKDCYILYLSTLRSYTGMGTFTVTVRDRVTKTSYTMDMDGIWEPRISVPADLPLKPEGQNYKCTGNCVVSVVTHPKHPDRQGNKVKVMSLSARKCRATDFPPELEQPQHAFFLG